MPEAEKTRDTLRLFFALWPDEETRARLVQHTRKITSSSGGRRVPAENLHITLAFLGSIAAHRLECVLDAAGGIATEEFSVTLDRVGHWPRPQILWFGPEHAPPAMAALAEALWSALERCHVERERRPFSAHLTLARKVRRVPVAADAVRPVPWVVRDFALVESVTHAQGARYLVRQSWRLSVASGPAEPA